MEYIVDNKLSKFEAWGGAERILTILRENHDCERVEEMIAKAFDIVPTETQVNDFLWFETDYIAKQLGYTDWDEYESAPFKMDD